MYTIHASSKFRRDVRRCSRQQKDMDKFKEISELLEAGSPLPERNKDHQLSGNWNDHRECHIEPDWLLIYRIDEDEAILEFVRMGSHSELFG